MAQYRAGYNPFMGSTFGPDYQGRTRGAPSRETLEGGGFNPQAQPPQFKMPRMDLSPLQGRLDEIAQSFGQYSGDQGKLWNEFMAGYQDFLGQNNQFRDEAMGKFGGYEQQIAGLQGQLAGLQQPQQQPSAAPTQEISFAAAPGAYFGLGGAGPGYNSRGYSF